MLINLSNHSVATWKEDQLKAAESEFTEIIDLPFPAVPPSSNEKHIEDLADEYFIQCAELLSKYPQGNNGVHIMGESTFCYALIKKLRDKKIRCIASTTKREVKISNGIKTSEFYFEKFRDYI